MHHVWGNLDERHEDELALVHPGMWERQLAPLTGLRSIQKQVEVDGSRAEAFLTHPAERLLHLKQESQQFLGGQSGLDLGNTVEVSSLAGRTADRIGFDKRGDTANLDDGMIAESGQGLIEIGLPFAEVAAQRDIGDNGHTSSPRKKSETRNPKSEIVSAFRISGFGFRISPKGVNGRLVAATTRASA